MTNSPNILLIMADQLAPHFTGAYGHPIVKTPNIDALAMRGTRFDSAYCNSPLCAPSRSAFMTGQLVSRTGVYDNAAELRASVPTFAHYLTRLGYRTCLSGRMHFVGPDQKHGFQDRVTTDVYPADFAWTPDWENHAVRIDSWYHNMQPVKESGVAQATFQMDFDDEAAFAARRWLFDYARDKAQGQASPFALVTSFMHPHDPYVARPEWWNLYADEDIGLPDFVPKPENQDAHSRRIQDGIGADAVDVTDEDIRRSRRAYLANVSYIDDKVGQLLRTLNEIGEMDNTIVIFTSDHGDMLGERGLWYKMTFFEHSARVPLIMAGPGIARGTAANACSLVDILPTLLEIGGGDDAMLGAPIEGRSLMPLARGEADPVDGAIGEYCGEMAPYPVFMIRRGPLKYVYCQPDPPLLYDLAADPQERNNLAEDPAYADQVAAFEAEVTERWDSERLRADVIANQKSRRAVHAAWQAGGVEHWDHNPPRVASQEYVRNHIDWTVADARNRFPPLDK